MIIRDHKFVFWIQNSEVGSLQQCLDLNTEDFSSSTARFFEKGVNSKFNADTAFQTYRNKVAKKRCLKLQISSALLYTIKKQDNKNVASLAKNCSECRGTGILFGSDYQTRLQLGYEFLNLDIRYQPSITRLCRMVLNHRIQLPGHFRAQPHRNSPRSPPPFPFKILFFFFFKEMVLKI